MVSSIKQGQSAQVAILTGERVSYPPDLPWVTDSYTVVTLLAATASEKLTQSDVIYSCSGGHQTNLCDDTQDRYELHTLQ